MYFCAEREGLLVRLRRPRELAPASLGSNPRHSLISLYLCFQCTSVRRERDSNPRYPLGVHTLSRRASSATPAPLQFMHGGIPSLISFNTCQERMGSAGTHAFSRRNVGMPVQPLLHLSSLCMEGFLPSTASIRVKNVWDRSRFFKE